VKAKRVLGNNKKNLSAPWAEGMGMINDRMKEDHYGQGPQELKLEKCNQESNNREKAADEWRGSGEGGVAPFSTSATRG